MNFFMVTSIIQDFERSHKTRLFHGGAQRHTAGTHAECLAPGQAPPLGARPRPWPQPRIPSCPGPGRDDTFKGPRASEGELSVAAAEAGLTAERGHRTSSPDPWLPWQRPAPQDRAPSAWAGRRRTPASWTPLASSLEGTRRRGARGLSEVTWPPRPSSPRPAARPTRTLWCTSSGALFPLLVLSPGGETSWVWPRRRAPRAQSRRSDDAETKAHCPDSSTWETPSPANPPNAGAPSSRLSAEDHHAHRMGGSDGGGGEEEEKEAAAVAVDSQPGETLTF